MRLQLPLPLLDNPLPIQRLVEYISVLNKHEPQNDVKEAVQYFYELLDAAVFEIYFPDAFKREGKSILKHLPADLPIVTANSVENILTFYRRWYDRAHPLRRNLEYYDTIEEVDLIRQYS